MAELRGGNSFEPTLELMQRMMTNASSVHVGFLAGATYPDGTPVALIAEIQNWGAPAAGIPPRPFFTDMIAKRSPEWGPATGALLVANGYDAARTLAMVGEAVAGQLRKSIIDTNEPTLALNTIRRKGHSKPLVDRAIMLNAIDYEVQE